MHEITRRRTKEGRNQRKRQNANGYIQGWNAQAAVEGTAQLIVAHGLTPSMSDQGQLEPLKPPGRYLDELLVLPQIAWAK
jgi:hypothetical protein